MNERLQRTLQGIGICLRLVFSWNYCKRFVDAWIAYHKGFKAGQGLPWLAAHMPETSKGFCKLRFRPWRRLELVGLYLTGLAPEELNGIEALMTDTGRQRL